MKVYKKEEIISKIPDNWKKINKEDYAMYGVHITKDFETIGAYTTPENIVSINSYKNIPEFLAGYIEQIKAIKEILKGKDWERISPINPLWFGYVEYDNIKLYVSILETNSTSKGVSLQVFYGDKDCLGFITSIKKPDDYNFEDLVKNNQVLNDIITILK